MSEIDLGSVKVALGPIPTSQGRPTEFKTKQYTSLQSLTSEAPFDVAIPSLTLPGHQFMDGAVIEKPAVAAALTYVEPTSGRHYIIVQSPIVGSEPVKAVGEQISATTVGDAEAAMVVGPAPAGTPRPVTLLWTKGDVLMQIIGLEYSIDDLQEVGRSL